tara:strand:+ start:1027 stop:1770 length:744 start_codon:yes stop_codon:yes gene_type:complete
MIYKDFIFIHIPKTAGSTIRSSLNKDSKLLYNGSPLNFKRIGIKKNDLLKNSNVKIYDFVDHMPYQAIKEIKHKNPNIIFTFVRNPYSRAVSLYFECIRNTKLRNELQITKNISFNEFLNNIKNKQHWFTLSMVQYIGKENIKKISFIGKIEKFKSDTKKLEVKYNIIIDNNFHNYNNSIGFKYLPSNYTDYYNNEKNIELVNIIYSEDFKTFNYNFNDFVIYEKNKTNKVIIAKNLISRFIKRKFK